MTQKIITTNGRQAGKVYQHLINTYIGLSPEQIKVIADPTMIHVTLRNVRTALVVRKLFTQDGKITKLGVSAQTIYAQIQNGAFAPDAPKMTDGMQDPTGLSRLKASKEMGLSSGHVKFLRSVLNFPGISIFHMEKIFGLYLFSELITRELVSRHEDSHQIYPTEKGTAFMKERIAELSQKKGKGNG
jgi:hypothetical protein